MRPAAVVLLCLLLAACGSEDDDPGGDGSGQAPGRDGARLTVTVRPDGDDGRARERRIECRRLGEGPAMCRRLAELRPETLAPVAAATACAELYGGPATARVSGELRGKRVDARFDRTDSCEIARWDENRALLGRGTP